MNLDNLDGPEPTENVFAPYISVGSTQQMTWDSNARSVWVNTTQQTWLCPDLLTIHQIGAADNLRGRIVRAFFRVLEWLPL